MKAFSLLYHDVVRRGEAAGSGFPGEAAARYKLEASAFVEQLTALAGAGEGRGAGRVTEAAGEARQTPLFLTFDDGGVSAHTVIAPILGGLGWPGHFFITVDYLDTPGFVSRDQVVDLRRQGHVIGSHSCSHPLRMARCGWNELLQEWQRSVEVLSRLLGEPVVTASVPGGYFSRQVARAAAAAGTRFLFTSEPVNRVHRVGDCLVLGRYTILRGHTPAQVVSLATGDLGAQVRQRLSWNVRKVAKALGGEAYLKIRRLILNRGR